MPAHISRHKAPERPRHVWFVCDVLGIVCAAATWALVLSAAGVLLCVLLLPTRDVAYAVTHGTLFLLLAFLALAAHARTMLTDPGSVPVDTEPSTPGGPRCPLCGAVQLARAQHCLVCGRCIRRLHHHCPWVNNCVGEDNQKYFLLFSLYTALAGLHVLLLLCVPALRSYARGEWDVHGIPTPPSSLVFLFLVALKGFFLGSVTFAIQMHAICIDRTTIEQQQRERGRPGPGSAWMNWKAVFGHCLSSCSPGSAPLPPQNPRGQAGTTM
ncbi:palmitoyltransferase ZDHHC3 [Rhinolophus sinicus]|uniref:palmitoyltransferase ZDHHC3 n=1 Tax=Rhinolophus sinicus TaxID=89399 RepID=UPI003D7915CC